MKLILAKLKDNEVKDNDAIAAALRKFDRAKKIAEVSSLGCDFLGAIKLALGRRDGVVVHELVVLELLGENELHMWCPV